MYLFEMVLLRSKYPREFNKRFKKDEKSNNNN